MSLKKRFAIFTLLFLSLAAVFLYVLEDQLDQVKRIRTHIKDDWKESRLLFEIQDRLVRLKDFETRPSTSVPQDVAEYRSLVEELRVHAEKDVRENSGELKELEAMTVLRANVAEWNELLGRHQSQPLDARQLRQEADTLYNRGSGGVLAFAHGSWEELDESLEDLSASEDRIERMMRTWTLGMLGLLALAWIGFFMWLMRPIARLRKLVRQFNKQDFDVELRDLGPTEIGELMRAFRDMAREIIAFTTDLERRVASRTRDLEASREQLRQMLDRLPDAVGLVDPDGRILLTNDGYRALLGSGSTSHVADILRRTPTEQGYYPWEISGSPHLLQAQTYRLHPHAGQPENYVTLEYVRDVTRQCEIEAALASSQTLAAVGRLSSGIAHEINNPLTAIAACSEGLLKRLHQNDLQPEVCEDYLTTIRDEVFRCKEITERLLDFSRQRREPPMLVNAGQTAREVVKLVEPLAARKNISITCNQTENQATYSSARAIKQVLLNLLMNAIEACDTNGHVDVSIETQGEELILRVADDGAGIPAEVLPHIFEPFFTQRKDNSGTGLGLFICQGIAQALGGRLTAESRDPQRGTVLTLVLPRRNRVARELEEFAEVAINA